MNKLEIMDSGNSSPISNKKKASHITAITGDIVYDNPLFRLPSVLQPYKTTLMSYSSSLIATTTGFPLDSLKTRIQTHPNQFKNSFHCLQYTITEEGISGLFRGLAAPLISTAVCRSFSVTIYSNVKPFFGNMLMDHRLSSNELINNFPVSFLSGLTGGSAATIIGCPFEITKIFSQILMLVRKDASSKVKIDSPKNEFLFKKTPTNVFQLGSTIIKFAGFKGLYSGYKYHLIRDGISGGLYYTIYETVKMASKNLLHDPEYTPTQHAVINQTSVLIGASLSGLISWGAVFPLDTIKSQYQKAILQNIVLVKSGQAPLPISEPKLNVPIKSLYKGIGPSLTRAMIVACIFFSSFEFLMKNIE